MVVDPLVFLKFARDRNDALHIAVATVHYVEYLLTWNCSHIANAEILPRVTTICERYDLALPYVCTPEELLGDPQ